MPTFMGTLHLNTKAAPAKYAVAAAAVTTVMHPQQHQHQHDGVEKRQHRRGPSGDALAAATVPLTQLPLLAPPPPPSGPTTTNAGPVRGKKLDTDLSIVLENVAAGFRQPNILDIKLGSVLWDEDAPPAKRARLDKVAAETTSKALGLRIAGMRVWQGRAPVGDVPAAKRRRTDESTNVEAGAEAEREVEVETGMADTARMEAPCQQPDGNVDGMVELAEDSGYKVYNKLYGRNFKAENVADGFREYLLVPTAGIAPRQAREVADRFRKDIIRLQGVLEREESRMLSSSLLLVYEGDPAALDLALSEEAGKTCRKGMEGFERQLQAHEGTDAGDSAEAEDEEDDDLDDEDEEEEPKVHVVKMIDFAHSTWTPGRGKDENVLHGLRSTVQILDSLLSEWKTSS